MTTALRTLLTGIVDYAGLFPPAARDLPEAVREYAGDRAGPDAWMLGRFVCGVAKLPELRATLVRTRPERLPWPVSVVVPDAAAATSALRAVDDDTVVIESVEVRVTTAADVALVARAASKSREVYVELAGPDGGMPAMLDAIAAARLRAKLRTGGVTADAFPAPEQVVRFLRGCLTRDLAFKATAGLHHPLRGRYRLTYEPQAPEGEMFGFLNVFLAAALLRQGVSDDEAREVLVEPDPAAFVVDDQAIRWREHQLEVGELRDLRSRFATSFGSCSFREPVDELPFPVAAA